MPEPLVLLLSAPYERVHEAVRDALGGVPGVVVLRQDARLGHIAARRRWLGPLFVDDIDVRLEPIGYRVRVEVVVHTQGPLRPAHANPALQRRLGTLIEAEVLRRSRHDAGRDGGPA